jgi:hypothetical protein
MSSRETGCGRSVAMKHAQLLYLIADQIRYAPLHYILGWWSQYSVLSVFHLMICNWKTRKTPFKPICLTLKINPVCTKAIVPEKWMN